MLILERILDNLLSNAVRHARGATRIDVDLAEGEHQGVRLTVSDDGPGIAAADRQRVLKAFARLHDRSPEPGVGLGLSLVSQFAAMHDGSVAVDETPGGGARFIVELPGGCSGTV